MLWELKKSLSVLAPFLQKCFHSTNWNWGLEPASVVFYYTVLLYQLNYTRIDRTTGFEPAYTNKIWARTLKRDLSLPFELICNDLLSRPNCKKSPQTIILLFLKTSGKSLGVSVPGIGHSDIRGLVTDRSMVRREPYRLRAWITGYPVPS